MDKLMKEVNDLNWYDYPTSNLPKSQNTDTVTKCSLPIVALERILESMDSNNIAPSTPSTDVLRNNINL